MTEIARTHVSTWPGNTITVEPREQIANHRWNKPSGFWYEVDGDWRRWCETENWGTAADPANYRLFSVDLGDTHMLNLRTVEEILRFDEEYGIEEEKAIDGGRTYRFSLGIDWPLVAELYDGIEIAPYQWHLGLDTEILWYYGWDCASGAIWQPRGVTVTAVEDTP